MRIALVQMNVRVGDVGGNRAHIIRLLHTAATDHGAQLVIFPELAVVGYPPDDLLLRPHLYRQVDDALDAIATAAGKTGVLVGLPQRIGTEIFNSCVYLKDGRPRLTYHKRVLPNYGVFDEKRYFTAGRDLRVLQLDGIACSISICEDLWTPEHARDSASAGARLLININASPFHADKHEERIALLQRRTSESGLGIVYVNLVGGQDELVFDGASMAMTADGEVAFAGAHFEEGLYLLDITERDGRIRMQPSLPSFPPPERLDRIYRSLVLGVRDYVDKNGFRGAVLGLSGGIDSALTLCIAVAALGPDRVEALIMPSRYTADMSIDDSMLLGRTLGVQCHTIAIEGPVQAFDIALRPLFAGLAADTTEENIQARCRGILLMAVSNKSGRMVLATGNKSEMSVGYATLYGDMAGGFAPLKDVAKTLVYELANWINRDAEVIPRRIIDRPPSAELRPDQKDEDSLPPYHLLDAILHCYVEDDMSPEEIVCQGFDRGMVARVAALVDRNEYKRRQAAPGIKISKRAFGRDRRYPITSGYRED